MKRYGYFLLSCLALVLSGCHSDAETPPPASRPNLLLIVLDDVGFGDLGVYGSEIRTPNIDALASQGTAFTDFHTSPMCSPTRAMLLSGVDNHLAGVGNMSHMLAENQKGQVGYEGYLNDQVVSLARLLRDGGYNTYMAGKWHLGYGDGYRPARRGFDRSFALLDAGASHFGDMRGLVEYRSRASYVEDDVPVEVLPEDFHSSSYFTDKLIEYQAAGDPAEPFFAYLALTAPHWPLGVPEEYLDLYAGFYDEGYDLWRERRVDGLMAAGSVPGGIAPAERLNGVAAWDDLSPEARKVESRKMELYAAMIEHLDLQIGRLLSHLDEAGVLDNTAVVVMSDNGPEGNDRSLVATNREWLPQAWDLSFENMGKPDSYVYYGAGWGQVSAAPYRLFKAFTAEGGTRVPLLVKLPEGIRINEFSAEFATVVDIAPTLLDLAQVDPPQSVYDGKAVHPMQGASLVPYLLGERDFVHDDEFAFGWELFGHRAIRKGSWKLLWIDDGEGNGAWQLFDLASDPGERTDLSLQEPDKLKEMQDAWTQYVQRNNVILPESNQGKVFTY
jgi:arylsulfatase